MFLLEYKLKIFSEWLLLNQACCEELEGRSLREITKNKNQPIYRQMLGHFTESFLVMSKEDEGTLAKYKNEFKKRKKQYEVTAYILQCLNVEGEWQLALQSYQFYNENLRD